ncbi:hypothetical protein BpHYR1_048006 [Brachionus plicatilis]|uniref:Uncharacterized protein n=1 Tax=Brachionus plicatilis TaxID=10195 RepID=A0A3M7T9G5_BRAPC|nr:hypothetical protein BpHYR1_048006 [Brachionus plicatilis]
MNNYLNYLSSNISIDHMCSIKCLRKILSIVFQHAGLINTTKIFSFLSTALTEIRKNSNPELIDNVIGCVYELSNNFHHDFLFEVLKFGEEIGLKLIEICEFLNTGVNSKEIVLKFLILQINLRKNTEKTDFKINSLWTEIVKSAYEWSKEETFTNIRQQLASISTHVARTLLFDPFTRRLEVNDQFKISIQFEDRLTYYIYVI